MDDDRRAQPSVRGLEWMWKLKQTKIRCIVLRCGESLLAGAGRDAARPCLPGWEATEIKRALFTRSSRAPPAHLERPSHTKITNVIMVRISLS